jgi:hypothetical protein
MADEVGGHNNFTGSPRNIHSLLSYKSFILTKIIRQPIQVLLPFCCDLMWAPLTALLTSKQNSTHPTPERSSTGTTAVEDIILLRKSGEDSTLSLCTMSSMYRQKKKSMGVKVGIRGCHITGTHLPIHLPGNRSSRAVSTMAPKWAGAPSCWKMRPSTSATICGNTKFSSISRQTALLVEGAGSDNSIRCDAASNVDLGAVANGLN